MKKMYVLCVDGGLGKHISATSFLPKIKDAIGGDGVDLAIMSLYPDFFVNHPSVDKVFTYDQPGVFDKYLKSGIIDDVKFVDPYRSMFLKGDVSLNNAWSEVLGVFGEDTNSVYISDVIKEGSEKILEQINGDFIIAQFFGGQPFNYKNQYFLRGDGKVCDYPLKKAQILVDMIREEYPDLKIVNFGLSNELSSKLVGVETTHIPAIFFVPLLHSAKSFISIDSALQHMASTRTMKKNGVVLWGSSSADVWGYEKNINIRKEGSVPTNRPLQIPFGDIKNADGSVFLNDKTLMDIDPEVVLEALKKSIDQNSTISNDGDYITDAIEPEMNPEQYRPLKAKTANLIKQIKDQAVGLQHRIEEIVDTHTEAAGLEGKWTVTPDGKYLKKVS